MAMTPSPLADESRSALEVLSHAVDTLGAADLRAQHEKLARALTRDDIVVQLEGPARAGALGVLTQVDLITPTLASGVSLAIRAGEMDYHARFANGREEQAPADDPSLAAAMADVERAIAFDTAKTHRLSAQLQAAAREAAHARAHLAVVERDLTALRQPESSTEPIVVTSALIKKATPPRRSLWARIVAFFRRLFGRKPSPPPALPASAPLPVSEVSAEFPPQDEETLVAGSARGIQTLEQRVAEEEAAVAPTAEAVAQLEGRVRELKARLVDLGSERVRLRKELTAHHEERRRQLGERIRELLQEPNVTLDVRAPGVPEGVTLRLGDAPDADLMIRVDDPAADLGARLRELRAHRAAELARLLTATLCGCRNRILDLDRRTRAQHEERLAELGARRLPPAEARRHQEEAQLAMGRHAEQIIAGAVAQLERMLKEVRAAWHERIEGCRGSEQLRAEVGAIETGAAYRLQLVCDELREKITLGAVRVVLELSRPLRQELARKRLEVARGRSVDVPESFENVRLQLPEAMEATFGALTTPELGELLATERGLLDPLFRTLAREKRQCQAKLGARLDDIERQTVRELYAAAVYLSPLLLSTFDRVVEELLALHEGWVEASVSDENRAHEIELERQAPARAMIEMLEQKEQTLGRLLEAN